MRLLGILKWRATDSPCGLRRIPQLSFLFGFAATSITPPKKNNKYG